MKLLISLLILSASLCAQVFTIQGTVHDAVSGKPLPYANIRVAESGTGAAANTEGNFLLKLPSGEYTLIATFIGYISDSIKVQLPQSQKTLHFKLAPSTVTLSDVIVLPGENPALAIIKKAVLRKKEREGSLYRYQNNTYSKLIVESDQQNLMIGSSSVGVSANTESTDSSELNINAIFENASENYFRKPGSKKEIIRGRKQTANIPSYVNTLTGGRIIQDFYSNDVAFFGVSLVSPISDDALDYYFFYIADTLSIDNKNIYRIAVTPDNPNNPGFEGSIDVFDGTFDLAGVSLTLNRAANPGGIFDSVRVNQSFLTYGKSGFTMPVDYRLSARVSLLGFIKIGFSLNSIMYDYLLNEDASFSDDVFNSALITVTTDADEADSTFWEKIQVIPATGKEVLAYQRIDSLSQIPISFWDRFSFLSPTIQVSDNVSISAPLGMYHFNRVEGNSLDYSVFVYDLWKQRINTSVSASYGFADKRFKGTLNGSVLLGDYRTQRFYFSLHRKLTELFEPGAPPYGDFFTSLNSLLSKYEFTDYFYSEGIKIGYSDELIPYLNGRLSFENRTDRSATVNSDFSFFNRDKQYPAVQPIDPVRLNLITVGFTFNPAPYIEDGMFRRRTGMRDFRFSLSGDATLSGKKTFGSEADFTIYTASLNTAFRLFRTHTLSVDIRGFYANNPLPFQMLQALPGNIDLSAQRGTFRTAGYHKVAGDQSAMVFLEYDFSDRLFKTLNVPLLKDMDIQFSAFLNGTITSLSDKNAIHRGKVKEYARPFYEAGFTIGHLLFPVQLSFAWKLNQRDENNFRIGLTSFIFD